MSTPVSCPCNRYYDGSCTAVDTCERQTITIPMAEVSARAAHCHVEYIEHTERAELLEHTELAEHREHLARAGFAAVIGGAVSMALGEYVSVSSQRDSERALRFSQLVNPWSAGIASFISFILGAALPFAAALFAPVSVIFGVTFVALTLTGALSAHLSGVPKTRAVLRIVIGGMLALAVTFAVGSIFGAAI
ncbi:VIT1/CCC1 transporter family protein [Corynebacterium macclintockiae]|uniref:VIT1/CCC1 transporter family protein n=1 Tax=Corynebacterium macclintockiae TaxID=2913501 RepID=UPI003EB6A4B9